MLLPHIIDIHGYGGRTNASQMYLALSTALQRQQLRAELLAFAWDSLAMTPEQMVYSFLESQRRTEEAGAALLARLHALEAAHTPYALVGYSLGAAVIRHALAQADTLLTHLRGIYLLGAAFNHSCTLNEQVIPARARCHNYYSPADDLTLSVAYANVSGEEAAGQVGLSRTRRFVNLHTQCSHVALFNYTVLADSIVSLMAWDAGQRQAGKGKRSLPLPTGGGKSFWNAICRLNQVVVQQNLYSGYYRAITAAPPYLEVAWAERLHPLLRTIDS